MENLISLQDQDKHAEERGRQKPKTQQNIEALGSFLKRVDFALRPLDSPAMTLRTHTQLLALPSCNLKLSNHHKPGDTPCCCFNVTPT